MLADDAVIPVTDDINRFAFPLALAPERSIICTKMAKYGSARE